jgi:hypothetical protein
MLLFYRGGGNKSNAQLNNAAVPAVWMGNEAIMAGLYLKPSRVEWNWQALRDDPLTDSLNWKWGILELLPIRHLTYKDKTNTWL